MDAACSKNEGQIYSNQDANWAVFTRKEHQIYTSCHFQVLSSQNKIKNMTFYCLNCLFVLEV